jgi:hypothetical protein
MFERNTLVRCLHAALPDYESFLGPGSYAAIQISTCSIPSDYAERMDAATGEISAVGPTDTPRVPQCVTRRCG